ncbi:MAG: CocE/NonD family hydrolase [Bryobacteraceae bacterium]
MPLLLLLAAAVLAAQDVDLGGVREEHVMAPMRDGVRLSIYLYFPPGNGPWPVLLEQRYASTRSASSRRNYARLAQGGFVVAAQNFRGTQLSEGHYDGYRALGWGKLRDGYDTVEWLAKQPWSTGKIGTFGGSQAGYAQNFLAVTQPPHLVAQYMTDTGLSLFHLGYRRGGTTRPRRFLSMLEVCRDPADGLRWLEETLLHPTYDDYWRDEDCTLHFGEMNVPAFTLGSWYDFMNVGSIDSYIGRQHKGGPNSRGKQQLILGPWLHGGNKAVPKVGDMDYTATGGFDMPAHMIRWFDFYLKGKPTGVDKDPTVRYFTMGTDVWHEAPDWPVPAKETSYWLHGGGKLDLRAASEGRTDFISDPDNPAPVPGRSFPGAQDGRRWEQHRDSRTFTTEPLAADVEWTGNVKAEIWLSSTAKDTDVMLRVSDVYPDGRSILILDAIQRARYWQGFEREVLLESGKPVPLRFDVGWLSQVFRKGHRIRIGVGSTGADLYEPNPNTGLRITSGVPQKTVVATDTVHHGGAMASRVIAPVVASR